MNRSKLASELVTIAKIITAQSEILYKEWEKMGVRGQIKFVRGEGGKVSKWNPGQGWKYVMELKNTVIRLPNGGFMTGESSEGCILLAVYSLGRKAGIDVAKIQQKADGERSSLSSLKEWAPLTKIPTTSDARTWNTLLDDLQDVNYHSFQSELSDALEEAGIV